jgi:hypothetical protein
MTNIQDFKTAASKIGIYGGDGDDFSDVEVASSEYEDYTEHIDRNCPPARVFTHWYMHQGLKSVRRAFRNANGMKFETGQEAVERTSKVAFDEIWKEVVDAYVAGTMVGHHHEPDSGEQYWMNLVEDPLFRMMKTMHCVDLYADEEMVETLKGYLTFVVENVAQDTGFVIVDSEVAHKVWDVWFYVVQATCTSLFVTGYEVGKRRKEMDVLNSILNTSEDE